VLLGVAFITFFSLVCVESLVVFIALMKKTMPETLLVAVDWAWERTKESRWYQTRGRWRVMSIQDRMRRRDKTGQM
jgi:hypothetical protein